MTTCRLLLAFLLPALPLARQGADQPSTGKASAETGTISTVDDVRALEKQVQSALTGAMPALVLVEKTHAAGSGVIVSADGIILTTCSCVGGVPGESVSVILADGRRLKGKCLGVDFADDCAMIQIEAPGPFPFAPLGDSSKLRRGDWCIALGHPGGPRPNRGAVVRVGRVLSASATLLRSDCALVGGDSGGPLFDVHGNLIGTHSRMGNIMTENFHIAIDAFRRSWDRLRAGEEWGRWYRVVIEPAGGEIVLIKPAEIAADDPRTSTVAGVPGRRHKQCQIEMEPGFAYTIDMQSLAIDSYLYLEDAHGKHLAENDDGGGGQDARIVYRPSRSGTYLLKLCAFNDESIGPFIVTVHRAAIDAQHLPNGKVDVLAALKMSADKLQQEVKVYRSSYVSTCIIAHLVDDAGKPVSGRQATFRWDGGHKDVTSDDQGRVRLPLPTSRLDSLVLELPDGLRAMIRLSDDAGNPLKK